jgi:hypothetical protein
LLLPKVHHPTSKYKGGKAYPALRSAKPYYFTFLTSNCGVQHSDLAVVGRKSGCPKMPDDDFCMI